MLAETLFPLIDFDWFHREELPARIAAGHGALASAALSAARPLAVRLTSGEGYTYVPGRGTVSIEAGTSTADTVVEMDAGTWSDYLNEMRSAFGLLYAQLVRCPRGSLDELIAWEPAIRALYTGRAVYDPAAVSLTGIDGSPLDLQRTFRVDSPAEEIAHFVRAAGFVHVRGVFDAGEIAELVSEVEHLQAMARPGDDRSWWAETDDGTEVCCRLTFINERAPSTARLHTDPRVVALVDAVRGEAPLAIQDTRGDGDTVVIKNPGAVKGLSDLPWHVDCGLGGHPVMCPGINLGIQLDAATAESGQLHFLAGSNGRTAFHLPADRLAGAAYPTVAVTTEPGDVTIHWNDTLHAAPSPSGGGAGRRALYLSFNNPRIADVIPEGSGYNDVVLRSGEGNRVLSVEDQLAPT